MMAHCHRRQPRVVQLTVLVRFLAAIPPCFAPFSRRSCGFQTHLPCGSPSFMEDQAVKIVGEIGECELGLCTRKTDGADEQTISSFLMREDMLDPGPHR